MPTYSYRCPSCGNEFDRIVRLAKRKDPQPCDICDHPECMKLIVPVAFNLPGDGWASKNERVRGQMAAKNDRLKAKEEEMKRDAPAVKLAPNVMGERTDTWTEAKKLAESKGKDTSSYDAHIRQEAELQRKPA